MYEKCAAAMPWIRHLQDTARADVVKACSLARVVRNQLIVRERATADRIFGIAEGALAVWKRRGDGRDQVTAFLFNGDMFGIAAGATYFSSVRALTDANLAWLTQESIEELTTRHADLRHALYARVTSDFALAQDQLLILGALNARERVAAALLHFDRRQRARGLSPDVPLWLPMRRTDLASYLGLELPTLSRMFSRLSAEGLIATPRKTQVVLRDRGALSHLSGEALR
jgi:CRP/FNR family transcriptional regulator